MYSGSNMATEIALFDGAGNKSNVLWEMSREFGSARRYSRWFALYTQKGFLTYIWSSFILVHIITHHIYFKNTHMQSHETNVLAANKVYF